MKRILFLLLAVLMLIMAPTMQLHAQAAESGVTWDLTEGVLTISGTGAMEDYASASDAPWYSQRTSVVSVVVEEGVTTIGDRAFYNCTALKDVTIADSVTTIGTYAFRGCTALEAVEIPAGVTEVKASAFRACTALTEITLEGNAPTMGGYVFNDGTDSLTVKYYEGSAGFDGDFWADYTLSPQHVGQWVVDPKPTCTTDGSRSIYCTYCQETFTETLPGGHNYVDGRCSICEEVQILASGSCGDDLQWKLDETGLLTIWGSSTMYDYNYYSSHAPWYDYRNLVAAVIVEDGVTTIGDYAFYSCTSLSSITIPEGVTTIGDWALYCCTSLSSITIPEGVTSIDVRAFSGCTSLTSITIPDSVTSIGSCAFSGCSGLESMTIPFVGGSVKTEDDTYQYPFGYIFGKYSYTGGTETKQYYYGSSTSSTTNETYYIPSGLKMVTVTGGNILYGAFYGCNNLTGITLPEDITSIGGSAFYNCTNLCSIMIPDSVTTIGRSAFYNCASLSSITIPDSVTSIGDYAFYSCDSLDGIWVEDGNLSYSSDDCGVLFNKNKTQLIQAPGMISGAYFVPKGVTSIDYYVFADCTSLESITIPDSVTSIGNEAFGGCTSLSSIIIPEGVTSIGRSAFYNCTSLRSITIPDSVTWIGSAAFSGCSALESMTIPFVGDRVNTATDTYQYPFGYIFGERSYTGGVETTQRYQYSSTGSITDDTYYIPSRLKSVTITGGNILYGAFYNCSNLTAVTLPEGITSIGRSAFENCTGLEKVEITDIAAWCQISFGNDYSNPLYYADNGLYLNGEPITEAVLPDSITSIPNYVFHNCKSLSSITISDSVISIGNHAFGGCTSLRSITIPESVTEIGGYVFARCTSLESIAIPESVTEIGGGAFQSCSMTSITIPDSVTSIGSLAFYNCGSLSSITLPNSITIIEYGMFEDCTSLSSITIPDSVTEISEYVFAGCTSLRSITIPESVTSIGFRAFENCIGLEKVEITDIAAWCGINFADYYSNPLYYANNGLYLNGEPITNLVLPDTITSVPAYAFGNCTSLTSVTILGSLTVIDFRMFYNCTSLRSITLPDSVTSIGQRAFQDCTSLSSIALPDSVTYINSNAFEDCTSLSSITLPDSVTYIGSDAFCNCIGLNTVFYTGTETQKTGISLDSNEALTAAVWHYEVTEAILDNQTVYHCGVCGLYYYPDGTKAPMKQLVILTAPDKQSYLTGDILSLEGISLQGTYENGMTITLGESEIDRVEADLTSAGRKKVTVFQAGCSAEFEVVVHDFESIDASNYPESDHDYGNNLNETKTFSYPGAQKLIITFNSQTNVESGYDFIYVYDGSGNEITRYTGTNAANVTLTIPGDTFKIKLTSDGSVTRYGYGFSRIVADGADKIIHPPIVDAATATCTGPGLTEGSHCEICGMVLVEQVQTDALGHSYEAEFTWSEDHNSCTAAITCIRLCGEQTTKECVVTTDVFDTFQTVHTATAAHNNETFSDTLSCSNYVITFADWDGSEISANYYHLGDEVVMPSNPVRMANNTYTYTFAGWDKEVVACAGNVTYTATYTPAYIDYTVIFADEDGTELSRETYHWGDEITVPADPTKAADNTYAYTFAGWDKEVVACAGNVTYTATYTPACIDYTVIFADEDGTELSRETYHWGDEITVAADPTKAADNTYAYTFAGWDKEVVACAGNVTYTATYTPAYIDYTVIFADEDGAELSRETYHWGDEITVPADPTKAEDENYTYVFAGWDKEVVLCAGDAIYTATYKATEKTPVEETEPTTPPTEETEPTTPPTEETEPTTPPAEEDEPMENPFVDVFESDYYYDPVLWAVSKGITNGMDATHFAPDGTCTRAQIVTFLWRANGSPEANGTNPFTDVPADAWYTDAVLWAVENGITTGTSATTFSPDAGCTRGQVATFLWRSQGQPWVDGVNIFTDIDYGAYYYDPVLWAVDEGITNGVGEGLFAPDATCTRGQIVTFLYRAMK